MSGEIHLLKGSDAVLLGDAVRALVDRLVGDGSRDEVLAEFTGDDYDLNAVVLAAQTVSMFGDRIVVAHNLGRYGRGRATTADDDGPEAEADDEPGRTAADIAPLLGYLDDPAPDTHVVLVWSPPLTPQVPRGPVPKKLIDAVKAAGGTVSTHGTPSGRGVDIWLDERIGASSVVLAPAARRLVGERLGEDVTRIGGVLSVLEATFGDGVGPLGPDDVEPFLGDAGGVPPWDLTDAIDRGQVATAVSHLRRMVDGGGRHPLQVMASLNKHFATMLRLDGAGIRSKAEAAEVLGIKPYPAEKALQQSAKLGSERIARAMRLLATADVDLRGRTGVPSTAVMEVLVARLAQLSGGRSGRAAAVSQRRR